MNPSENIYLMGFMGAGKSSLGKTLARKLEYHFLDLDKEIEKNEQSSIPEIFAQKGEEYFRLIENQTLETISKKTKTVIALGGGTPLMKKNRDIISKNISIYIKLPPEALFQRLIKSKNPRPLLKDLHGNDLLEFIKSKLMERSDFYEQANLVIDGHSIQIQTVINAIEEFKNQQKNEF